MKQFIFLPVLFLAVNLNFAIGQGFTKPENKNNLFFSQSAAVIKPALQFEKPLSWNGQVMTGKVNVNNLDYLMRTAPVSAPLNLLPPAKFSNSGKKSSNVLGLICTITGLGLGGFGAASYYMGVTDANSASTPAQTKKAEDKKSLGMNLMIGGGSLVVIGIISSSIHNHQRKKEAQKEQAEIEKKKQQDAINAEYAYQQKILADSMAFETFKITAAKYRALSIKPQPSEEVRRFMVQATSATEEKRYDDALNLLGKAINADETFPLAHFNRALIYGEVFLKYREAILEMKKYVLLVPDASDARASQDKVYEWEAKMRK